MPSNLLEKMLDERCLGGVGLERCMPKAAIDYRLLIGICMALMMKLTGGCCPRVAVPYVDVLTWKNLLTYPKHLDRYYYWVLRTCANTRVSEW